MDPQSQPTLQEIADLSGVSKTTVSLALRNHPKISEKTRKKVEEVATSIGYHPNPLVSAHMSMLRSNRVPQYRATLGVITDWPLDQLKNAHDASEHYSESTIWRYVTGIRKRARELGFEVDIFSIKEEGMTGRRLSQIMRSRGIGGVLMTPLSCAEGTLDLDWDRFAVVALGYSMRSPTVHRVCHDNYSTMRVVMKYLMDLGFSRIRLAMDLEDDVRVKNLWSAGYSSRTSLNDSYRDARNFVSGNWQSEGFLNWIKDEGPDCVICIGDTVYDWSQEAGYEHPADFALVTLGKIEGNISGYSQNSEMMGEAAVERVVGLLHCNDYGLPRNPQNVLVQGEWVDGDTLGHSASGVVPELSAAFRSTCSPDVGFKSS